MKITINRIVPIVFALFGVIDFIYGIVKPDIISLGIGVLMVGISLYVLKKNDTSA